jgi:cardiolipin synthase
MRQIPNILTMVRIGLTPYIFYLIVTGECSRALLVTLIAGLTDAADGLLARHFGWLTRLGAYLDPVADKLLLTLLYVSFALGELVPHWLVWLVVGRDILILALVAVGWTIGLREFPPSLWGKVSTVVQIAAAIVFLGGCAGVSFLKENLANAAVWLTAAATASSGIHYARRAFFLLRLHRESAPTKRV